MAKEFPEILPAGEKNKMQAATTYVPTPSREERMRAELSDLNKDMSSKEFEATIKVAVAIANKKGYKDCENTLRTAEKEFAECHKKLADKYQNKPDGQSQEGTDGQIVLPRKDNPKESRVVDLKGNDRIEYAKKSDAVEVADKSRSDYIEKHIPADIQDHELVDSYYLKPILENTMPPAQQQDASKAQAKPKAAPSK